MTTFGQGQSGAMSDAPLTEPQPRRQSLLAGFDRAVVERAITWAVVAAVTLLLFKAFQPSKLFSNTTPTGGDAHTAAPAILRDHFLPQWRLTGYTTAWYAGMSLYQFYMVLPPLLIVILDLFLPYGIAFKLVTVLGSLLLPYAAYTMGRLMRLPFPAPALMAAATLPFLFDRGTGGVGTNIFGGTITSTMAGEFNFSIALALSLIAIGLVYRAMNEQTGRIAAAVMVALTVMCHLLVGFFMVTALLTMALVFAAHSLISSTRTTTTDESVPAKRWAWFTYTAPALVLSVLLTAWWLLPFWHHRELTFDMGWTKDTRYSDVLFRGDIMWAIVLACFAIAFGVWLKSKALLSMSAWLVVLGLIVRYIPDGRLWNLRMLPGYWLTLYLLAAVGVVAVVKGALTALEVRRADQRLEIESVAAIVTTVAVLFFIALPMRLIPGSKTVGGTEAMFGFGAKHHYLKGWIGGNYTGYEDDPDWPEYANLMATMEQVGQDNGCGRAFWEYDGDQIGRYGTTMALMNLPYFTDWCIDSLEGVYFESSATTPFNFLLAAEGSVKPSNPIRDFGYNGPFGENGLFRRLGTEQKVDGQSSTWSIDTTVFDSAVSHMQLLGVRYYMAVTPDVIATASAHEDLTQLTTSGPWVIFSVADSENVVGLERLPYVEAGSDATSSRWRDTGVALWDLGADGFYAAPRGPKDWPRITQGQDLPTVPVNQPAQVSNIQVNEHGSAISFDVDQVGKPVLVKWSYDPNFRVEGASGPYRVTPNFMVVVPTETSVRLEYGRGTDEYIGYALTWIGIGGLVALGITERRRRRRPRVTTEEAPVEPVPATPTAPVAVPSL
jgi:hypothetical protein